MAGRRYQLQNVVEAFLESDIITAQLASQTTAPFIFTLFTGSDLLARQFVADDKEQGAAVARSAAVGTELHSFEPPKGGAEKEKRAYKQAQLHDLIDVFLKFPRKASPENPVTKPELAMFDQILRIVVQLKYGVDDYDGIDWMAWSAMTHSMPNVNPVPHDHGDLDGFAKIRRMDIIRANESATRKELLSLLDDVEIAIRHPINEARAKAEAQEAADKEARRLDRLEKRAKPAVGRYADKQEVLPQHDGHCNWGADRAVLVRRGTKTLLAREGHKYCNGMMDTHYVQFQVTLYDKGTAGRRNLGRDLFEGGRVTKARMLEHKEALVEFFGVEFNPADIRRDSTLILDDEPTKKKG